MFGVYLPDDTTVIVLLWFCIWVFGLLGNILSAIVWLRRQVATKNSSAAYLAALAINDMVYLLSVPVLFVIYGMMDFRDYDYSDYKAYLVLLVGILCNASFTLEPLLVLGFSIERLIAIRHPLQVSIL